MKRQLKQFNVIVYNINTKHFEPFDVIPYLASEYKKTNKKKTFFKRPVTHEEFKEFVKRASMWRWWSRCEYEIILSDWPPSKREEKWDVHKQVLMNLDVIATLLMESVL